MPTLYNARTVAVTVAMGEQVLFEKGIRTIQFLCCRNDGIEKQNHQYTYA